jgi:acyl-CoA hydrolase
MTDTQAVHAPPVTETEPCGDLCTRTLAMPADTNQNGDIFGGWLLSQMDIGGGIFASKIVAVPCAAPPRHTSRNRPPYPFPYPFPYLLA